MPTSQDGGIEYACSPYARININKFICAFWKSAIRSFTCYMLVWWSVSFYNYKQGWKLCCVNINGYGLLTLE